MLFSYRFVDRRVTDYHGGIAKPAPPLPSSLHSFEFDTTGAAVGRGTATYCFARRASLALAPLGVHAPRVRGVLENEYRVRALHDSG